MIREERIKHEITQQELANRIKISRPALANIEAGRQRILLHHIFAVEKVFGVMNYLINIARGRNTG